MILCVIKKEILELDNLFFVFVDEDILEIKDEKFNEIY